VKLGTAIEEAFRYRPTPGAVPKEPELAPAAPEVAKDADEPAELLPVEPLDQPVEPLLLEELEPELALAELEPPVVVPVGGCGRVMVPGVVNRPPGPCNPVVLMPIGGSG
jgi:hypothetical protein